MKAHTKFASNGAGTTQLGTADVTAIFEAAVGVLEATGGNDADAMIFSRTLGGAIRVNNGATPIGPDLPTIANTLLIQADGLGGNDVIEIDETNGVLPAAVISGGAGNDRATGGSGNDDIFGDDGNDALSGKGGTDTLHGGLGNDILTGGTGDDIMLGEGGDDRMIWNPGEASDVMNGGDGNDTAVSNGGNADEVFTLTTNGADLRFDRVSPAPFHLDISNTENVLINGGGGNDTIQLTGNIAPIAAVVIDGGTGNDSILSGNGNDLIIGGEGDDFVQAGVGADRALLGTGNDTFLWAPGEGSDVVEGQAGLDRMQFNGSNASETMVVKADGARGVLTRDVAAITMDTGSVETFEIHALAGTDHITVENVTGSAIGKVEIDLAATIDGATGDAAVDTVVALGTDGIDKVTVTGTPADLAVNGLPAAIAIAQGEVQDHLVLETGAGDDKINASTLAPGAMSLTIDGGAGNDGIVGSTAADLIFGGDGNDKVVGGRGNDTAFLGDGNDVFVWNPGEGSDVVEGGAGTDVMDFFGANIGENIDVSANGERTTFFRDIASITMDQNDVETIDFHALGGIDTVTVHDLSGTDTKLVDVDLASVAGGTTGDGQADRVEMHASSGADTLFVTGTAGTATVTGAAAKLVVGGGEAGDTLVVESDAGNDAISAVNFGGMKLAIDAGTGNDKVTGSAGADNLFGGAGNDVLRGNAGNDRIDGGTGVDQMTGGDGADRFTFRTIADSTVGARDAVLDFSHVQGDRIDLSAIDANGALAGNQAFAFLGEAAFDGSNGALRVAYGADFATVFGDVDGDKLADFAIRLEGVDAGQPLTAVDFVL